MSPAQARTVLGLGQNFNQDELKSQYRKKVLISHPDRNNGDDSRFILVQKAFEILSFHSTTNSNNINLNKQQTKDVYQARRKADEQYKERVKYYYRQKKKSEEQIDKEILNGFIDNVKYFVFTVVLIISLLIALVIAMTFGAVGVISLITILVVLHNRYDFTKLKL